MRDLIIRVAPPFRLDLTAWVLRRLPINSIDRWDGNTYRRVLVFDDTPVEVSVIQTGPPTAPELRIAVGGSAKKKHISEVLAAVEKMLGLGVDLTDFYHLAAKDEQLLTLVQRFVGLKPPRLPTVFEALVNGLACQQLSLNVGIHLLNRLSAAYGPKTGQWHAFPRAADLSDARTEDLRKLGFSSRKAQNILAISQATVAGQLDDQVFDSSDDSSVAVRLEELPGVGRWTAQYVTLRGLGRLNVFPADDVGGRNKLQKWLKLTKRLDYDAIHRILDRWNPYQGLIYFCLLLDHLERKKYL